jgi:hypothetical protein
MSRKHIVAFVITSILTVMLGAMLHEAFETGDTTPFSSDPELVFMMLGTMLILCLGIAVITVCQAHRNSSRPKLIRYKRPDLIPTFLGHALITEIDHLLFSPPRIAVSLRV